MSQSSIRTNVVVLLSLLTLIPSANAAAIVPGTGQKVSLVGDDFEDAKWKFIHNFPKSSEEEDENKRFPTGQAVNGRWYEGIKRGQPDFLRQVPTPAGGLADSQGALLMRTLRSGIPGRVTNRMMQDDLIVSCHTRLKRTIPVSQKPNCVVRVYMPPFEKWENRSGPTFGFRLSVLTHAWKVPEQQSRGFFRNTAKQYVTETYWPGMFVQFRSETSRNNNSDSAFFTIRGGRRGGDFRGPEIKQTGWWTLGMSCSPDGQIHYYAKPGVEELTADDHIASQYPYSYRAERFKTFFFNVCNRDDGRTWSTSWIIDDPSLYYMPARGRVAEKPARKPTR